MPDSNRGLYIAATVGAIFFAVTIGGAESRCQREQVAYGRQAAGAPAAEPLYQFAAERSWLPCLLERAVANPPSVDGTDKEQRDLIAQESAALWGFWIAVAALLQLVLSGLGLWALVRTLRQGQESLSHAQKVSALQLRPYLTTGGFKLKKRPDGCWEAEVEIRNDGAIPARDVKVDVNLAYRDIPLNKDPFEFDDDEPPFNLIGRKPAAIAHATTMTAEEEAEVRNLSGALLFRVRVRYRPMPDADIEEFEDLAMGIGDDLDTGSLRLVSPWAYGQSQ